MRQENRMFKIVLPNLIGRFLLYRETLVFHQALLIESSAKFCLLYITVWVFNNIYVCILYIYIWIFYVYHIFYLFASIEREYCDNVTGYSYKNNQKYLQCACQLIPPPPKKNGTDKISIWIIEDQPL